MLDEAMERLDVPLEDHTMEPSVSVQVDDTSADANTLETITVRSTARRYDAYSRCWAGTNPRAPSVR